MLNLCSKKHPKEILKVIIVKSGIFGGVLPPWLFFGQNGPKLVEAVHSGITEIKCQDAAEYVEFLLKEAPQGDFEGNF